MNRRLGQAWWVLFPAFALLVARLAAERACANPYDLLPALTAQPALALSMACVYLAGHLWMVATYFVSVEASGRWWPFAGSGSFRDRQQVAKLALMAGALAIEHAPLGVWRLVGTSLGCHW